MLPSLSYEDYKTIRMALWNSISTDSRAKRLYELLLTLYPELNQAFIKEANDWIFSDGEPDVDGGENDN